MKVVAIGLVAFSLMPAMAEAHASPRCPVGNSSANQYREDIPTASGCRPSSGGGSHGSGSSRNVAPATARALRRQGRTGVQAAALAQATAPAGVQGTPPAAVAKGGGGSGSAGHHRSHRASSPPPSRQSQSRQGQSPSARLPAAASAASQLAKALTGSSGIGLGLLLPVILVGMAAVALAAVVLKRRRQAPVSPTLDPARGRGFPGGR